MVQLLQGAERWYIARRIFRCRKDWFENRPTRAVGVYLCDLAFGPIVLIFVQMSKSMLNLCCNQHIEKATLRCAQEYQPR